MYRLLHMDTHCMPPDIQSTADCAHDACCNATSSASRKLQHCPSVSCQKASCAFAPASALSGTPQHGNSSMSTLACRYEGVGCTLDINECVRGTADCPANAGCVNSNGSYSCPCFYGYQQWAGEGLHICLSAQSKAAPQLRRCLSLPC